MPIPQPTPKESESDFISRCMADDKAVEEFPDSPQRFAVCNTQWMENKFQEIRTHLYNNK